MIKKISTQAAILTLISSSLIGCGAATVGEYKEFAKAGSNYAEALDTLLATSSDYFIDANSERLLRSDLGKPETDTTTYRAITDSDEQWLVLLARMRRH